MLRKNFMKFESTSELHKELTNIPLLATEDSNFFYCYCEKDGKKCDLCDYVIIYLMKTISWRVYQQKIFTIKL